jgi:hypothetical protein
MALVNGSIAAACPLCDSETGRQVQAEIFNDQFWSNLLLTLSPFPVLLAIVALIYFDFSLPWKKNQAHSQAMNASLPSTSKENESWPTQ